MSSAPFVHLHVHTHHSLRGGLASVESLMRRAAELEMSALAITDRLSLGGLVEAFDAGRRFGVKPILGADLPLARVWPRAPSPVAPGAHGDLCEITLLAASDLGLRNLITLTNLAAARTPPHVTVRDLAERREGLIALLGGPRSELAELVGSHTAAEIDHWLTAVVGAIGQENVAFEVVERRGGPLGDTNHRLQKIAEFLNVPAVAANDVWHLEPSQALAHDFLAGRPLDPSRWPLGQRRNPPTAHFTTPAEMRERHTHQANLLDATLALAARCNAGLDLGRRRFPQHDFTRGVDANSFLWDLVFRQAPERLGGLSEEAKERLNAELNHIAEEGLGNYVVLLWRLAEALDRRGIHRGVGEGRLVTSLVAHVLGLTEVNPLLHRLAFTGLREAGEAWPCLGLEVAARALPQVEEELCRLCGQAKVARAGESPPVPSKRLRRALCEWAGLPAAQVTKALSLWPKRTVSLAEAQRAWEESQAAEGERPASLPRPVITYLCQAIHPARAAAEPRGGEVIVSGEDLTPLLPMAPCAGSSLPLAQLDPEALDTLGLLRLAIRTPPAMDILDRATEWVRREEDSDFRPERIPFDDHDTWVLIGRGLTTGIPGLHRISTKSRLRARQPRSLEQLLEAIGPGPALDDEEEFPEERTVPPLADAILALRCAHLKTHHAVSFMAAMFTQHLRDRRLFRVLLREATALGVRLLAPDINTSLLEFTQEGSAIRAGLMAVKGMTPEAFASIDRARRGGPFQDLRDLWARVDQRVVPPGLVTSLIKGGVLDGLDSDRARMLAQVSRITRGGPRPGEIASAALDLFDLAEAGPEEANTRLDAATLARYEQQVLGTVLTGDPLSPHAGLIRRTRAVSPLAIQSAAEGEELCAVGFIDHDERCDLFGDGEPHPILDFEGQVVLVTPELHATLREDLADGEPFLILGTVGRHSHARYLRAHAVLPLDRVERMAGAIAAVGLDLAQENRRTVKHLIALCQQYPGATKIELTAPPPGVSRRLTHRLESLSVLCVPPLMMGLRKILPEEAITLRQRHAAEVAVAV